MNFEVDPTYLSAVEQFQWGQTDRLEDGSALDEKDVEALTKQIAEKIIVASQLRPQLSTMAQRELSLREIIYVIAQQEDQRSGRSVVQKIGGLSSIEKDCLKRALEKLTVSFEQLERDDLKVPTLLFGVHLIARIAKEQKIVPLQEELGALEKMEIELGKLKSIRAQYGNVPECQKDFIDKVDAAIAQTEVKVNALRHAASEAQTKVASK